MGVNKHLAFSSFVCIYVCISIYVSVCRERLVDSVARKNVDCFASLLCGIGILLLTGLNLRVTFKVRLVCHVLNRPCQDFRFSYR